MKNTTLSLNEIYINIFPQIGIILEDNGSISIIQDNKKELVTYNKKPLMMKNNAINCISFNPTTLKYNCTCHMLENQILKTLSSKINLLFIYLIKSIIDKNLIEESNTELNDLVLRLYENNIDFEEESIDKEILDKWTEIYNILENQESKNLLIKFNFFNTPAFINRPEHINNDEYNIGDDDIVKFSSLQPFIKVTFPLYELLEEVSDNKLLGLTIEDKYTRIFKSIYEYLFKDIHVNNSHIYPECFMLKDFINDKKYKSKKYTIISCYPIRRAKSLLLLRTFVSLANKIDILLNRILFLDEIKIENEMFNLSIPEELVKNFEEENEYSNDCEDEEDLRNEIKKINIVNIKILNNNLNNIGIKKNDLGLLSYLNKKNRNFNKKRRLTLFDAPNIDNLITLDPKILLDPDKEDFNEFIPKEERLNHTLSLGASGTGKSELIKTLLYNDIQKSESSIVLLDPHGDLAFEVSRMIKEKKRLIYIDLDICKDKIFTINPFDIKSKDESVISTMTQELLSALEVGLDIEWSNNMEAILEPCISTLLRKGDTDLYELQRFMEDSKNEDLVELGKKSPIKGHREFFYSYFKKEKFTVSKDAIAIKLQVLLNNPTLSNSITGKSTIDLEKEINTKGKVIIFKLSKGKMKKAFNLYNKLIMATIQGIVLRRANISKDLRTSTHLYIDEFKNFIGSTIEEILTESRKYKLFLTFANQSLSQIDKRLRDIVLSNTNIKIIGKNSNENLRLMGKEIQVDINKLENLNRGEFFLKVGTSESIKIQNTDKFIGDKAVINNSLWEEYLEYQFKNYYRNIADENNQLELKEKNLKPLLEDF